MAWGYLFLAAVFEIGMAIALKLNEGWTRLVPSVLAVLCGLISIYLLALSMRTLPVGTAYAVWTGTGAVGIATLGILFFHEAASFLRIFFLVLTFVGIMGLRFASTEV